MQEDPEELQEDSAKERPPKTRRGPKPRSKSQVIPEESERDEDEIEEEAIEDDLNADDDHDD